jgi:hypothetical protein
MAVISMFIDNNTNSIKKIIWNQVVSIHYNFSKLPSQILTFNENERLCQLIN